MSLGDRRTQHAVSRSAVLCYLLTGGAFSSSRPTCLIPPSIVRWCPPRSVSFVMLPGGDMRFSSIFSYATDVSCSCQLRLLTLSMAFVNFVFSLTQIDACLFSVPIYDV